MSSLPSKYNNIQVALHWLVAVMVIVLLIMGNAVLSRTANTDPSKIMGLRAHMLVGGAALILTVVRLLWRRATTQPLHTKTGNEKLDWFGVAAHQALNILVFLVAASGIGIALQAGLPGIVFGMEGALPETFFVFPSRIAHGVLTKLLLALILLHVLGAVYHQFFLKDRLFKRVWFGRS